MDPEKRSHVDESILRELRELVSVHNVALQRLLFEQPASMRVLAELFRDIGNTYIRVCNTLRKIEGNRRDEGEN